MRSLKQLRKEAEIPLGQVVKDEIIYIEHCVRRALKVGKSFAYVETVELKHKLVREAVIEAVEKEGFTVKDRGRQGDGFMHLLEISWEKLEDGK